MSAITIPPMDGDAAYPRKNGEPVFDAPWQSRAFGMVVGLHTAGAFPWSEFKERLIDRIASGSADVCPSEAQPYYYQWVEAFCRLLDAEGMVTAAELGEREREFLDGRRQQIF